MKKKIKSGYKLTWAQRATLRKRSTQTNAGAGWHEGRKRDPRREYDKDFLETYDDEWNPMHA